MLCILCNINAQAAAAKNKEINKCKLTDIVIPPLWGGTQDELVKQDLVSNKTWQHT